MNADFKMTNEHAWHRFSLAQRQVFRLITTGGRRNTQRKRWLRLKKWSRDMNRWREKVL